MIEQSAGTATSDAVERLAWLMDESPATLSWVATQDDEASRTLHALPDYPALVASLAADRPLPRAAPTAAGDRWLRLNSVPGYSYPVLEMSPEPAGPAQVVFDPAACTDGPALLGFHASPGGNAVALLLAKSASAPIVVRVLDLASGQLLPDRVETGTGPLSPAQLAWCPDGTGFFVVRCLDGATRWGPRGLFHHTLGGSSVAEPLSVDDLALEPQVSADGRYVVLLTQAATSPRPAWIKDLHGDREWRSLLPDLDGRCRGVVVGDRYVAVTTEEADRGRLVAIPLQSAQFRSTWQELRPESPRVMWALTPVGSHLVLVELEDATVIFTVLDRDGREVQSLRAPCPGAVGLLAPGRLCGGDMVSGTEDSLVFGHQSQLATPAVYRYDLNARTTHEIEPPVRRLDGVVTRRLRTEASDGTRLAVQLAFRQDLDLSTPRPMLMTGYGGAGVADLPMYPPTAIPFIRAGGIFAWATIRGGGEYGERWRREGNGASKRRHVDDFCEIAEFLVGEELTTPHQLAVHGASNGGLLVAAALAHRPELFGAAAVLIPFTDLIHYDRDELAARWLVPQWGNPQDPVQATHLHELSPVHALREGVTYPPTVVVYGDRDDMSPGWHARVFAARLAEASSGGQVLLRRWQGFGHIEAAAAPPSHTAEWLAFLMHHVGLHADS